MNTDTVQTKHTLGPWKVLHTPTRKESFYAICTENAAPLQAVIALVDCKSKAHEEQPHLPAGNARLIAAAPDLLEACKQARFLEPRNGFDAEEIRIFGIIKDAVAKAEGR